MPIRLYMDENVVLSYSLKTDALIDGYFNSQDLDKVCSLAKQSLNTKRFLHCKEVGKMLYRLHPSLKEDTSFLLGYFHDITKDWSIQKQKDYINNSTEELYEKEEDSPEVFHAISACILFKKTFPKAPFIFSLAIRHHSILSYDIRDDLIYNLFTSDKIEESRSYIDDNFRSFVLSKKTAEERAYEVLKYEKTFLEAKGKKHLPTTEKLLKSLEKKYAAV